MSQSASSPSQSLKRKRSDAAAGETDDVKPNHLRFKQGQKVLCNVSTKARGFLWRVGTIAETSYKVQSQTLPYLVQLDDGGKGGCPEDDDECVRLAARAHLDTRVMHASAVPEADRSSVTLRFAEGDRVAVQLDAGHWEEGVVIEVWYAAQRNRKVLRTWGGLAVPYLVRLDLGTNVMVPFDSDEVLRAESSAGRLPQKSVAEQVGGTNPTPAHPNGKRFVKQQNSAGEWVRVDSTTGCERPCDPPSSDEEV